jgi:aconitate hydratase
VGMGILPLQFRAGESAESLCLDGTELYTIRGVANAAPGSTVHVSARRAGQADIEFDTVSRLDSETDVDYLRNGGILPLVLRQLMGS